MKPTACVIAGMLRGFAGFSQLCLRYTNTAFIGVYNTTSEFTEVNLGFDGEFEEFFTGKFHKTQNGKVLLPTGECPAQMLIVSKD